MPELHAHFVAEVGNLFQRAGIALRDAKERRIFQRNELMFRHGKLAQP